MLATAWDQTLVCLGHDGKSPTWVVPYSCGQKSLLLFWLHAKSMLIQRCGLKYTGRLWIFANNRDLVQLHRLHCESCAGTTCGSTVCVLLRLDVSSIAYFLNFLLNEEGRRQYSFYWQNRDGTAGNYYRCTRLTNMQQDHCMQEPRARARWMC